MLLCRSFNIRQHYLHKVPNSQTHINQSIHCLTLCEQPIIFASPMLVQQPIVSATPMLVQQPINSASKVPIVTPLPTTATIRKGICCMEEQCSFTCSRLTQLKKHLINEHGINFNGTIQTFKSNAGK
jgi:hypothetical protein